MKNFFSLLIVNFSFLIITCFAQQPGWQVIPSGTTSELKSIHYVNQYNLFICGEVLINVKSTDNGSTWQTTTFTSPVTLNDIFVIDDNTIITVGSGGTILRTTDAGINWDTVSSGVTDDLLSISFMGDFGIIGAFSQTILYSSNAGATWNIAQTGFFGGGFPGAVMLSPQIGFVAGTNSIFQPLLGVTTDMGATWDFHSFYLDINEGDATGVDFTDLSTGFVSAVDWMGRGAIAKTTDGGLNWVTTFFTQPLWSIDFPISGASLIGYAAGEQGTILKTYDAGLNWQSQLTGTTQNLNKIYFSNLDEGYAVGENGTILRTTNGGEPITNVDDDINSNFAFQLYQNYPNPFNPTTKIKFTIPNVETHRDASLQMVTLKVYDVLGNEIGTRVNKELPAGEYDFEFNASSLTSGIYFYTLTAGNYSSTKKMILMR